MVFTSKGTVGRFAFVKDDTPRFVYSPQLCYWRSLNADIHKLELKEGRRLGPDYLCELLNAPGMQRMVSGYATGTTVNMLPSDALKRPPVSIPPAPLTGLFGKVAADVRTRREALVRECRALAAARDELLPRLVSGRLRATG